MQQQGSGRREREFTYVGVDYTMFLFEIYCKKLYQKPDDAEDPYACVLQLQLFTATVRMHSGR
jgi:hypothetical protein